MSTTTTRCGTVAIMGRPNVGKSTLLNAILGQKVAATTHKPQTTRRALRGVETRGNAQIVFVDTPGLHKPTRGLHAFMIGEAIEAAKGVDVVAFVVEAVSGPRHKGAPRDKGHNGGPRGGPRGGPKGADAAAGSPAGAAAAGRIHPADVAALEQLERAGALKVPVVLVVNKVDTVADKRLLLPLLDAWSKGDRFAALIPLSAAKGQGVDVLVDDLAARMPEGPFLFEPDAVTDTSEREIAAELIREKVMLELRQELPYRAAVVVEAVDESRREDKKKPLVTVSAVIHVERDSQKAMVIGKKGQRIKAIGERARKELEKLLGCKVHLELLVRVEPDWTTNAKGLRKLGYAPR